MSQHFVFSVEGNIGTGKSSFLEVIKKYFCDIQVIKEPIEKWTKVGSDGECGNNLLDMFYNNPERWSYAFQTRCSFTKAMEYDNLTAPIVFTERSWLSDRYVFTETLYEMNMMKKIERDMHNDWFNWLLKKTQAPDAIIYLKASPNICFDRLIHRNRHEEASMNFSYLSIVDKKYNEWLIDNNGNNIPVVVIDADDDFEDIEHRHLEIVELLVEKFPFLNRFRKIPNEEVYSDSDEEKAPWVTVNKKKYKFNKRRKPFITTKKD